MEEPVLYVPVVNDEALQLSEDIANIVVIKRCLDQLSTCCLSKDDKWQVLSLINDYERKLRSKLRTEHLTGPQTKVYESLRNRLKLELNNNLFGEEAL
jgi:hypothetical protein|tara:strand:- start:436 stop:729 length:294 start_codon:yes stop_codon:yes gene_type:complete